MESEYWFVLLADCKTYGVGGRWGPEGGKTLMALFRRLRSPSAMGYVRN